MIIQNIRLMLVVEIDKGVEKQRLLKEIEKFSKEIEKIQIKLDNPAYIERAPKDIIERDSLRVGELSGKITQFEEQLNALN